MRLGIAGYHRGFELKEKIAAELKLPEYRRAASQQGVDRFVCKGFVGLERD